MSARTVNVGGCQGRGNPVRTSRCPAPDALSIAIAAHLIETTADASIDGTRRPRLNGDNLYSGNILAWWLIRQQRLRALSEAAAVARHYGPWWPADSARMCQVCLTHSDSMHRAAACAVARLDCNETCGDPDAGPTYLQRAMDQRRGLR